MDSDEFEKTVRSIMNAEVSTGSAAAKAVEKLPRKIEIDGFSMAIKIKMKRLVIGHSEEL